jgi:nucleoid DNA-binding protein
MDIPKYIGLFLLKNHFCYVHGLGNMELKKRPATYDGKALQAPSYEVVVTMGGSIDDNLANFIATNEQISISKAANTLREYSIQTRKELAEGKEVPIPNIGRFVEQAGKVKFITDERFQFTPAGIPTIRNSKQLDEQNSKPAHKPSYPPPHKADSINWSMVILVIVLLIIIGGGVFGVYYYNSQNKNNSPVTVQKDSVIQAPPPLSPADTARLHNDSAAAINAAPVQTVDSLKEYPFKMIIGSYPSKDKADKRLFNLKKGGNEVEMVQKDSTNYLIIANISCRAADTAHVKDSLIRMFGYKGVTIYK